MINGAFDLDTALNLVRSRAPIAADAYLVLDSPHGSQEATYAVQFIDVAGAKWLELADFYVGQVEGVPPRGIKVGWPSAGMAALDPAQGARSFIAFGDHSSSPEECAIATNPPSPVRVETDVLYRVRHQLSFDSGINRVRFRLWPDGETEPDAWLCEEQDSQVPAQLPHHAYASFALFQHFGLPVEWSDILVTALELPDHEQPDPRAGREWFLGRERPSSF